MSATNPSQSELGMTLHKLVARLSQRQREVFILRHWHGFSTEETAEQLGLNCGTVKSHLKRAIDHLKHELASEWAPPAATTAEPLQPSKHKNKG